MGGGAAVPHASPTILPTEPLLLTPTAVPVCFIPTAPGSTLRSEVVFLDRRRGLPIRRLDAGKEIAVHPPAEEALQRRLKDAASARVSIQLPNLPPASPRS